MSNLQGLLVHIGPHRCYVMEPIGILNDKEQRVAMIVEVPPKGKTSSYLIDVTLVRKCFLKERLLPIFSMLHSLLGRSRKRAYDAIALLAMLHPSKVPKGEIDHNV